MILIHLCCNNFKECANYLYNFHCGVAYKKRVSNNSVIAKSHLMKNSCSKVTTTGSSLGLTAYIKKQYEFSQSGPA